MDALQARALLFQRKLAIKNVDWSIPQVPKLDNQLAIIELGEDQIAHCSKLAEQPDGTINNAIAGAASICKSLVMRDTKERLCSDNDAQEVSTWGHSVLKPLADLVEEVSALSVSALAVAKKSLPTTPGSDSSTILPTASEATPDQS